MLCFPVKQFGVGDDEVLILDLPTIRMCYGHLLLHQDPSTLHILNPESLPIVLHCDGINSIFIWQAMQG